MASDVLGAFKILINAKPDEAVDAFQKILDSTKKTTDSFNIFSSAITGLNQGFELIGKAKDLVVGVGETFLSAAHGLKEFVSAGGDYKEQRNQLELMAQSYGLSGEKILQSIKNITDGSISIKDSMDVAAKAINTGLSGPEIEKVLTYSKKFSEAVGADFKGMSEAMIKAMEKGSGESLEKFGLMVNKGASVAEVLKEIEKEMARFGDTGFNAADKFNAISNSMEEFGLRTGKAINDSKSFGELISNLKDEVIQFVDNFDYTQISTFTEVAVQSLLAIADVFGIGFKDQFDAIKQGFKGAFVDGGNIAKTVFTGIIEATGNVILAIGSIKNAFITILQGLNFGNWFETAIKGIKFAVVELVSFVASQFSGLLANIGDAISSFVDNAPKLALSLGLDEDVADKFYALAASAENFGINISKDLNGVSSSFSDVIRQADTWNQSLEQSTTDLNAVANSTEQLKQKIAGIEFKDSIESTENLKSAFDIASNGASKIGKAVQETSEKAKGSAKEAAQSITESFRSIGQGISEGLQGAFSSVNVALQGYIDAIKQGVGPGGEIKIKAQLEEERFTRDRMISALEDLQSSLENYDPATIFENMKLVVQVTGDDILDKLFKEAIIRAEAEGVLVAGV